MGVYHFRQTAISHFISAPEKRVRPPSKIVWRKREYFSKIRDVAHRLATFSIFMAKIPTVSGGVFHGDSLDCSDSFFDILIGVLATIHFNPDGKRSLTH